jgi:hypothetical protein
MLNVILLPSNITQAYSVYKDDIGVHDDSPSFVKDKEVNL